MTDRVQRPWVARNDDSHDFAEEVVVAVSDIPTVTINYISLEEDLWTGVWQSGKQAKTLNGSRTDVLRWAAAQPADHYLLFSLSTEDFVPVTRDELS